MRNSFIALCILSLVTSVVIIAMPRTTDNAREEYRQASSEVRNTSRLIEDKDKEIARRLNELNSLTAQIEEHNLAIDTLKREIAKIDSMTIVLNDSIVSLEASLKIMREQYAQTLRDIRSRRRVISDFAFIFSSGSFQQAYKRIRYLQQFSRWRKSKAQEIRAVIAGIDEQRKMLSRLQSSKTEAIATIELSRSQLQQKQTRSATLLAELRKEEKRLRAYLRQQQRLVQELDNEIDRLIAEERRQAEERRRREAEERRRRDEEERRRREEEQRRQEAQQTQAAAEPVTPAAPLASSSPTTPVATPSAPTFDGSAEDNNVISGSFASNQGRLPFPVSGSYRIVCRFGQKKYAASKIEIVNKGVDIEVPVGASARAIYDGVVKIVTERGTLNTVVIITHGEYIALYANLDKVNVKPGDKVKACQAIGTIFSENSDRGVLHFEMRKGGTQLDPLKWVK